MNNIIEKLGITPIKEHETQITSFLRADIFKYDEVKELERQRNEMLEALIDATIESKEESWSDIPWRHFISIIEKATDKPWGEVKGILDE